MNGRLDSPRLAQLRFLGMVAVLGGPVAAIEAASPLRQTAALLSELRETLGETRMPGVAAVAEGRKAAEKMKAAFAMVDAMTPSPCDEPGVVFLSSGQFLEISGYGVLELEVMGDFGAQELSFASGTAQADVLIAVNAFTAATGVAAIQGQQNSQRIKFVSAGSGSSHFVRVKYPASRGGYPYNLLATSEWGPVVTTDLLDYGHDGLPGDANCDWSVDLVDLGLVLGGWGACPKSSGPCAGDVDMNGVVDIDDVLRVIGNWGAPQ
jgi:hypothetical protein